MRMKRIVFALGVALLGGATLSAKVQKVTCFVNDIECSQAEREQLQPLRGMSLFFTNFDHTIPTLITTKTVVFSHSKKQLPGHLIVHLSAENPQYVIQDGQQQYTVYDSGLLLPLSDQPSNTQPKQNNFRQEKLKNNPLVMEAKIPLSSVSEENHINPSLHQELKNLSRSLYKSSFGLQNSQLIDTQTILLTIDSGITVYVPLEKTRTHVAELEILLNSNEVRTLPYPLREIDLRYKYPVLRTTE